MRDLVGLRGNGTSVANFLRSHWEGRRFPVFFLNWPSRCASRGSREYWQPLPFLIELRRHIKRDKTFLIRCILSFLIFKFYLTYCYVIVCIYIFNLKKLKIMKTIWSFCKVLKHIYCYISKSSICLAIREVRSSCLINSSFVITVTWKPVHC